MLDNGAVPPSTLGHDGRSAPPAFAPGVPRGDHTRRKLPGADTPRIPEAMRALSVAAARHADDHDRLLLGGQYEVGELIGRGGVAQVYQGRDVLSDRALAIKIPRCLPAVGDAFIAQFRQEARVGERLCHPGIVAVLDSGHAHFTGFGGASVMLPYLVMERVIGTTVRARLEEGPVTIAEALSITLGVLSALGHSHERGIVHGDISATNVMVTCAGTVKVMDFGCSQSPEDLDSTSPQVVFATPRYLCPEQAEGKSTDARSDLYSTGCLLYELLTGRPPFPAQTAVALAYQHVHVAPTPPSAHRLVGTELEQVVLHALTKTPAGRYQRAEQFQTDLRHIRAGLRPAPRSRR